MALATCPLAITPTPDTFAPRMESNHSGNNREPLLAHLSMFAACAIWGLMAPLGKDAMTHGLDGPSMVMLRVSGGALLFWITSLFTRREHVPLKHVLTFAGAAVFGIVCNQCGYTIGLSLTSPINASIVTTSMPIFAMLLAALILKEPITGKKALGVLLGCSGALMLILTSMSHASDKVGDIRGDLCCLGRSSPTPSTCRCSTSSSANTASSPSTSGCFSGPPSSSCLWLVPTRRSMISNPCPR